MNKGEHIWKKQRCKVIIKMCPLKVRYFKEKKKKGHFQHNKKIINKLDGDTLLK